MSERFEGKVAIVTGAGCVGAGWGNGRAIAVRLAEEGARVFAVDRDPQRLDETLSLAGAARASIVVHVCNVTSSAEVASMAQACLKQWGTIDILVNNVGGSSAPAGGYAALTDDHWQQALARNLLAAVRLDRALLPSMLAEGSGVIVHVSSTAAKRPSTGLPNYSVTKAAVLSLSRLVADLYAKDGIRCNAVTPGPTATSAWLGEGGLADQQAQRSGKTREAALDSVAAGRPLGRLAEPDEIASVIAFLCSERASYVTGAAWSADGGTVPIII